MKTNFTSIVVKSYQRAAEWLGDRLAGDIVNFIGQAITSKANKFNSHAIRSDSLNRLTSTDEERDWLELKR